MSLEWTGANLDEGVFPLEIQELWSSYVNKLDPVNRRRLLQKMGLPVDGFRSGTANIPDSLVEKTLIECPSRRQGRMFVKWFRSSHSRLMEKLESDSPEELAEAKEEWLKFPTEIMKIALLLSNRQELLEEWADEISSKEIQDMEKEVKWREETSIQVLEEMTDRILRLERELEELKAENKRLRDENRKVNTQRERVEKKMERMMEDAQKRTAKLQEEIKRWASMNEEKAREIKELRLIAEDQRRQIKDLEIKKEKQQEQQGEEALLRLYRALLEPLYPEQRPRRVLILGEQFPPQTIQFGGGCYTLEGLPLNEVTEIDPASYDAIYLLSLCDYETRVKINRLLSPYVLEIGSLYELQEELKEVTV